jgi:hypothetical protein
MASPQMHINDQLSLIIDAWQNFLLEKNVVHLVIQYFNDGTVKSNLLDVSCRDIEFVRRLEQDEYRFDQVIAYYRDFMQSPNIASVSWIMHPVMLERIMPLNTMNRMIDRLQEQLKAYDAETALLNASINPKLSDKQFAKSQRHALFTIIYVPSKATKKELCNRERATVKLHTIAGLRTIVELQLRVMRDTRKHITKQKI